MIILEMFPSTPYKRWSGSSCSKLTTLLVNVFDKISKVKLMMLRTTGPRSLRKSGAPGSINQIFIITLSPYKMATCGICTGLVNGLFAFHLGCCGFESYRDPCSINFSVPCSKPENPHPVSSELAKVISGWQSVNAESLNISKGIHLVKSLKLNKCIKNMTHTEAMCLIWIPIQGLSPG